MYYDEIWFLVSVYDSILNLYRKCKGTRRKKVLRAKPRRCLMDMKFKDGQNLSPSSFHWPSFPWSFWSLAYFVDTDCSAKLFPARHWMNHSAASALPFPMIDWWQPLQILIALCYLLAKGNSRPRFLGQRHLDTWIHFALGRVLPSSDPRDKLLISFACGDF